MRPLTDPHLENIVGTRVAIFIHRQTSMEYIWRHHHKAMWRNFWRPLYNGIIYRCHGLSITGVLSNNGVKCNPEERVLVKFKLRAKINFTFQNTLNSSHSRAEQWRTLGSNLGIMTTIYRDYVRYPGMEPKLTTILMLWGIHYGVIYDDRPI